MYYRAVIMGVVLGIAFHSWWMLLFGLSAYVLGGNIERWTR